MWLAERVIGASLSLVCPGQEIRRVLPTILGFAAPQTASYLASPPQQMPSGFSPEIPMQLELKMEMEEKLEKEEGVKKMELEMEWTRIEVQGCKFQHGKGESTESQICESSKLVPAFDKTRVMEFFLGFEKKAREFE